MKKNDSKNPLRVLYLFAGQRKKVEEDFNRGLMPDSFLIGFNHFKNFGIDATYIENKFLNYIRKKNYNLTNLFLIPFLGRYDIVFSGASLSLPFLAKCILRFKKPKFIWYNTFFTNIIKRNQNKPIRLWAVRKTIASLDAIFCPSSAQRQFLIEQGFDANKIFFIPNGIDVEFMQRKKEEQKDIPRNVEPFILSVGKDMGRDYVTLAEAVRGLSIQVKVAALPRNFSDVKEIPSNLHILGFVPFGDLIKLYNQAEFVVIPTKSEKHTDASDCSGQYVLLDAMSLGKTVLASRRETLADYLSNGVDGVIVEPENSIALREAIVGLINDPERARLMGDRAGKRAEAHFTTKCLAENLVDIFKKVLAK
ncbi:MAG: glycosyltransferase family 4 protein [Patescibacteria group bacterium]